MRNLIWLGVVAVLMVAVAGALDRHRPAADAAGSLCVPTSGLIGFLYNPPVHNGVDIWTNTFGTGNIGSKGSAVYAAADGVVTLYHDPNGGYGVRLQHPSLNVWTHYWHMGDKASDISYVDSALFNGKSIARVPCSDIRVTAEQPQETSRTFT